MPTKHVKIENALVGIGAEILIALDRGKPISSLFHDVQSRRKALDLSTIHFDWFLLALDFLYVIGTVKLEAGIIKKLNQ